MPPSKEGFPIDARLRQVDASWRRVAPLDGELARWVCLDGRWLALAVGFGQTAGSILVVDSNGRCDTAEDYDAAIALASDWPSPPR